MLKIKIPIDSALEEILRELGPGGHLSDYTKWDWVKLCNYMIFRTFHGRPNGEGSLRKPHNNPKALIEWGLFHLPDEIPEPPELDLVALPPRSD